MTKSHRHQSEYQSENQSEYHRMSRPTPTHGHVRLCVFQQPYASDPARPSVSDFTLQCSIQPTDVIPTLYRNRFSHDFSDLAGIARQQHLICARWRKICVTNGEKVARLTGLEPATPGVTGRYSNQLSYNRA